MYIFSRAKINRNIFAHLSIDPPRFARGVRPGPQNLTTMLGRCKAVSLLFLIGFHVSLPQTFEFQSQNFCQLNQFGPDNLSCSNAPIEGVDCFSRTQLCNGTIDCSDGSDEGLQNGLECKLNTVY